MNLRAKNLQKSKHSSSIFENLSIEKILKLYRKKKIKPSDIAMASAEFIIRNDKKYKAWVVFDQEKLVKQSRRSDVRVLSGEKLGEMEGIPVGVKDIFNTLDFPTEMGSPIWKSFTPGNDARVVYYLRKEGAIIPGKTVTAEFAVHSLNEATINPHDEKLTPGTSSSGSAVAVATGMVPFALGTQTAGSIIRPASFCGIYGFKPSFGLIPRTGMLKTTDSLDSIGFFVFHIEDLKRVFNVIRVKGENYPISNLALKDSLGQQGMPGFKWKVAISKTHLWDNIPVYAQSSFLKWTKSLQRLGKIEIEEVDLPAAMKNAHETHLKIYDKTLSYYFKNEFKKSKLVSPILKKMIKHGMEIKVEEYVKALSVQNHLAKLMDKFLQRYDILITLSTAGTAPSRNNEEKPDPSLMWTMTYLPVLGAPVFETEDNLPFGVQMTTRRYDDFKLINFANYLHRLGKIPDGPFPKLGL